MISSKNPIPQRRTHRSKLAFGSDQRLSSRRHQKPVTTFHQGTRNASAYGILQVDRPIDIRSILTTGMVTKQLDPDNSLYAPGPYRLKERAYKKEYYIGPPEPKPYRLGSAQATETHDVTLPTGIFAIVQIPNLSFHNIRPGGIGEGFFPVPAFMEWAGQFQEGQTLFLEGKTKPYFEGFPFVRRFKNMKPGDWLAITGRPLQETSWVEFTKEEDPKDRRLIYHFDILVQANAIDLDLPLTELPLNRQSCIFQMITKAYITTEAPSDKPTKERRERDDKLKRKQEAHAAFLRKLETEGLRREFLESAMKERFQSGREISMIDGLVEVGGKVMGVKSFPMDWAVFDYHFGPLDWVTPRGVKRLVPGVMQSDMVFQQMVLEGLLKHGLSPQRFATYHVNQVENIQLKFAFFPGTFAGVRVKGLEVVPNDHAILIRAEGAEIFTAPSENRLMTGKGRLGASLGKIELEIPLT